MPPDAPISPSAFAIYAVFLGLAFYVFTQAVIRIRADGGKVRTDALGLPELLMSLVFAGFFGMLMVSALRHSGEKIAEISIDKVLPNSVLFIVFSVGILAFLHYARRLRVSTLFGLDRLSPLATVGWSCGLVLAALPLAGLANVITLQWLQGKVAPQPLVELFTDVAQAQDFPAIAKIFIAGVIIAPCCEEFLFRGFFYGVWKRYLGMPAAGLLACLLFAAFHGSLFAFGGLFVLAICLNIAYERTGSLLVPIGMHALFNFTSLLVLYLQARYGPAL